MGDTKQSLDTEVSPILLCFVSLYRYFIIKEPSIPKIQGIDTCCSPCCFSKRPQKIQARLKNFLLPNIFVSTCSEEDRLINFYYSSLTFFFNLKMLELKCL